SFVEFFEKLKATEKAKHSALAKAFSTHPMTEDRIKRSSQLIEQDLPAKDDYVVTTSEFDDVKARLAAISYRHHIEPGKGDKPVLRKRDAASQDKKDEDRPKLERKPS